MQSRKGVSRFCEVRESSLSGCSDIIRVSRGWDCRAAGPLARYENIARCAKSGADKRRCPLRSAKNEGCEWITHPSYIMTQNTHLLRVLCLAGKAASNR